MKPIISALSIVAALVTFVGIADAQGTLSSADVERAIELGRQGRDLSVRVGAIVVGNTTCSVTFEGPAARIASAAAVATRAYRPFTSQNVTTAMRAETFVVELRTDRSFCGGHIVLQS